MSPNARKFLAAVTTAGFMGLSFTHHPVSHAFDFGDMMNLGKWMGNGRDRDDYYDGRYAGPGPWGAPYGGRPWGRPWDGGYGYRPGPYGVSPYGVPGYRGPVPRAAPRVAPKAPAAQAPSRAATTDNRPSHREIAELKRRIEELESRRRPATPPPATDQETKPRPTDRDSALIFRPLD